MRDPIDEFLADYPNAIQAISRRLRVIVRDAMPHAHEVLFARHNHIGYGFSESMGDRIVYICPMKDCVRLGFMWGGPLRDPEALLEGEGKHLRHIKVRTVSKAGRRAVKRLVRAAWAHAQSLPTRKRP